MAKKAKPKTRRATLLRAMLAMLCVLVLGVGYVAANIYIYGQRTAHSSAQAAIVLGAAVWGEEPSPVFRERINHAIALYHAGRVQKLLFTGGLGQGGNIAESDAAKRYAIQQGVLASDILTEDRSHTTLENLRCAQQVAHQHRLNHFLIVSDPLHMKRAMAMAEGIGLKAESSPTPTTRYKTLRSQWGLLMHETYFYLDYRLRHPL